jgi:phosphoserine aminotransferase
MPLEALETAAGKLTSYKVKGVSVMEMSHPQDTSGDLRCDGVADRELMSVPTITRCYSCRAAPGPSSPPCDEPMNGSGRAAMWSASASPTARWRKRYNRKGPGLAPHATRVTPMSRTCIHRVDPERLPAHHHNNTIFGTRMTALPDAGNVPLVATCPPTSCRGLRVRNSDVFTPGEEKHWPRGNDGGDRQAGPHGQ